MYNNGIEEPSTPVRLMLNVPGKTFEEKKKNALFLTYFLSFAFIVFSIILMCVVPIKTKFSCTHRIDSFDCKVHSSTLLRTLDTVNLDNVTHAVVGTQDDTGLQIHQMQFVDMNGDRLQYRDYLEYSNSSIEKQVAEINKFLNKNKDFKYTSWGSLTPIAATFLFLICGLWVFSHMRNLLNNFVYENVGGNTYQAVLKGKDLGRIMPSEVKAVTSGMFGNAGEHRSSIDLGGPARRPVQKRAPGYNPQKLTDEQIANLQDDELTRIQQEFYDRNN